MYQKTMFDRYFCIKSFCHLKTLEKRLEKLTFYITIMARKSMKNLYSIGHIVIPCAVWVKVSNIHFHVEKCILFKKKDVSNFFLLF